jgi:hypothetical protein
LTQLIVQSLGLLQQRRFFFFCPDGEFILKLTFGITPGGLSGLVIGITKLK